MDNLDSWRVFESTGRVEDYLKYTKEKRINRQEKTLFLR